MGVDPEPLSPATLHELLANQLYAIDADRLMSRGIRASHVQGLDVAAVDWLAESPNAGRLDAVSCFLYGYWLAARGGVDVDAIERFVHLRERVTDASDAAVDAYVAYAIALCQALRHMHGARVAWLRAVLEQLSDGPLPPNAFRAYAAWGGATTVRTAVERALQGPSPSRSSPNPHSIPSKPSPPPKEVSRLPDATVAWFGNTWPVMPREPRTGSLSGIGRVVRTRTWAGCTIMPDEEKRFPEVPVIDVEGVLVPLKIPPADTKLRTTMLRDAAGWVARQGYVGAGPPYVRKEDPWLVMPAEWVGAPVTVNGFWFPAFAAGTYAGWQIWGFYLV